MSDIRTSITLVDNFSAPAKGMAAAMTATVNECEKMKKTMGTAPDMSGYKNVQQQFTALGDAEKKAADGAEEFNSAQSAAAAGARTTADALEQQAARLRESAQAAQAKANAEEKAVSVYEQEYRAYEKNVNELGVLTEAQKRSVERYREVYEQKKKAAEQAQNLADKLRTESEMADKAAQSARKEADAYGDVYTSAEKMSGSFSTAADSMSNLMMAAGGYKIMQLVKSAFEETASAAIAYESAMTGVYKTVDGTAEQLEKLGTDVRSMALDMPSNTTEIAGVMEAAGQLGIATEDVTNFSRTMIDLGQATNLTADQAASSLAKFANITGMSADNYRNLGSVIVDLGNNFATTEADIVNMSTYLTSAASVAGFAETDILALSAAMSSVGINAEAGGSSMSKLISMMQTAVEVGGDGLEAFASVADMTAEEFATAWGTNAVGALQAFVGGLNDVERNGKSMSVILQDLDLDDIRMSNMLKALAQGNTVLTSAVEKANTAWKENKALTNEVEKRYATLESKTQMMKNAADDLKISVGNSLTPAMELATDAATGLLQSFTSVSDACPELSGGIMGAVGAVGGLGSIAMTTLPVVAQLSQAMQGLKASGLLSGALSGLSLGKVGLAIGGVAAIGALIGGLSGYFSKAKDEVEDYNGTLEQCYKEMQETAAVHTQAVEMYGAESAAAQELQGQLDTLTLQYKKGGGAAADYAQRAEENAKSFSEAHKQYADGLKSVEDTATSGLILAAQLETLGNKADKTNGDLETMTQLAQQLNDTYNIDVEINYDTGEIEGLEHIRDIIGDFTANAGKQEAIKFTTNSENIVALKKAYDDLAETESRKKTLESDLARVQNEHINTMYNSRTTSSSVAIPNKKYSEDHPKGAIMYDSKSYGNIKSDLESVENSLKSDREAVKGLENDFRDAFEKMGYSAEEIDEQLRLIETGAKTTSEEVEKGSTAACVGIGKALTEAKAAYDEAYAAAKKSFEGQFSLFDEAKADADATVAKFKEMQETQQKYWTDYSDNLKYLSQFTAEEWGMSEESYHQFIAQISDGSAQAAGLAANMRSDIEENGEEARKDIGETYDKTIEARNMAMETAAMFQTDLPQAMQDALDNTLDAVNGTADLFTDAGKKIDDKLAEGIRAGMSSAITAAQSVTDNIQRILNSISISVPTINSASDARMHLSGAYASGTMSAAPGLALVGENGPELVNFGGGEVVYTADETRQMMQRSMGTDVYIPKSAQEALGMREPEHDSSWNVGGSGDRTISININGGDTIKVQGNISRSDVCELLMSNLKPALMSIINEEIFEEGDGSYEY